MHNFIKLFVSLFSPRNVVTVFYYVIGLPVCFLSKIFPKQNIVVFGSRNGRAYDWNSRTLPETITIKGPQQQIERIDKVVIRANSTDEVTSSQSINDTEILLYDGDVILDKSLFTFNTENFSITIPVYMTKELPFSLQIQNAPPHFDVSSLKLNYSDEKIKVAGSAFVLENMDTISLGYIDLRDIDLDSSFEYSVVLPNDFRNLSDINTVTVSLNTDNLSSKVISLTKEQIHVINVPSEYDVDILSVGISNITIIGPSSVINRITPEDIIAEVDLRQEDIDQNTYTKTAKIYCPQNSKIWALDKINVGLEFTLKN